MERSGFILFGGWAINLNAKIWVSIRVKVMMLLLASLGLATFIVFMLNFALKVFYRASNGTPLQKTVDTFFNSIEKKIGITTAYIGLAFLLFLIIFYLFVHLYLRYLDELQYSVDTLAMNRTENFQIPVRSKDEFGELAISINRLVEKLNEAIQEERRAEQSKNELITNVSHDLRTPLTSIIGFLGYIEEDRYRDETELRYYVNIAYEKSQKLNVLVNDLFEYTRFRNVQLEMKRERLNLVEMLGQLIVEYRLQFEQYDLQCQLITKVDKLEINADGEKLIRVFENLLSNAIRYGKEGKLIKIELEQIENKAIVKVINYGKSIPAANLPYLFDRFYRVEKSRSEETGGSGLGLAIAKSIVELHDGRIDVESDVETVIFKVTLPLINIGQQVI